jgi:hypothetical protein
MSWEKIELTVKVANLIFRILMIIAEGVYFWMGIFANSEITSIKYLLISFAISFYLFSSTKRESE